MTRPSRIRAISMLLPLFLLVSGCASTPEPDPPVSDGISVWPVEEGKLFGGRAVYAVSAPLAIVRGVILDFDSHDDFRPMIVEAKEVEKSPAGGVVVYRFEGVLGIEPTATCRYVIEEEEGEFRLRFRMMNTYFALRDLRGGFFLRELSDGRTLVEQDFLVLAFMMNRDQFLAELRVDAEAIQARAVEMAQRGVESGGRVGGTPAGRE